MDHRGLTISENTAFAIVGWIMLWSVHAEVHSNVCIAGNLVILLVGCGLFALQSSAVPSPGDDVSITGNTIARMLGPGRGSDPRWSGIFVDQS